MIFHRHKYIILVFYFWIIPWILKVDFVRRVAIFDVDGSIRFWHPNVRWYVVLYRSIDSFQVNE